MTPENYKKLRSKIVAACPELLELSFGCKIALVLHNPVPTVRITGNFYNFGDDGKVWTLENGSNLAEKAKARNFYDCQIYTLDQVAIVGHPIRISHVLRAINKQSDYSTSRIIDMGGLFGYQMETGNSGVTWNLKQDDLSLQSDDVVEFLFDLFFSNESAK